MLLFIGKNQNHELRWYTMTENQSREAASKVFDQYMMDSLQSSREYSARLEQRIQQAVNFYLALLTALLGIGFVVIAGEHSERLRNLLLTINLAVVAVVGFLTFIWILVTVVQGVQEGIFQFFLHRYFRDKNPSAFDKYGLSSMLVWYRRSLDTSYAPAAFFAKNMTLLSLCLFNSIVSGITAVLGWHSLYHEYAYLPGAVAFVMVLLMHAGIWRTGNRAVDKFWSSSKRIIEDNLIRER